MIPTTVLAISTCVPDAAKPTRCATHGSGFAGNAVCKSAMRLMLGRVACPHCNVDPDATERHMVLTDEAYVLNPLLSKLFAAKRVVKPNFGNASTSRICFAMMAPNAHICRDGFELLEKTVNKNTGHVGRIAVENGPFPIPFLVSHVRAAEMKIGPAAFFTKLKTQKVEPGKPFTQNGKRITPCICSVHAPWLCYEGAGEADEMSAFVVEYTEDGHTFKKAYPACATCRTICEEEGVTGFKDNFRIELENILGRPIVNKPAISTTPIPTTQRTTAPVPAPNKATHADKPKTANMTNVVRLPPPARPVSAVPHQWDNTTASTSRPWLPLGPVRTAHDMELERRAKEAGDGPIDLSREGAKRRVNKPGSAKRKLSAEEAARREVAK